MPRPKPKKYEAGFDVPRRDNRELIQRIETECRHPLSDAGKKRLSDIIDEFRARREHGFLEKRPSEGAVNAALRILSRRALALSKSIENLDDISKMSIGAYGLLERLCRDTTGLRILADHAWATNAKRKQENGAGRKPDYTRDNLLRALYEFYKEEIGPRPTAYYSPAYGRSSPFMRMVFAIVEAVENAHRKAAAESAGRKHVENKLSQSEKEELRRDAGKAIKHLSK